MKKLQLVVIFLLGVCPSLSANAAIPSDAVDSLNSFSFFLFDKVLAESPDKTVVLSPFSADIALSMVVNGAVGPTQQAMLQALQHPGTGLDSLNDANRRIVAGLQTPAPGVELTVANSLWTRGILKPDFVSLAQSAYGADLGPLSGAPDNINTWVGDKTKGKITQLVSAQDVTPDVQAILVDAVYFKGSWARPFDKTLTSDKPFTLPAGGTRTCKMMQHGMGRDDRYPYFKGDGFEMVSLGYGADDSHAPNDVAMVLILPDKGRALVQLEQQLAKQTWQSLISSLQSTKGTVQLPKFHSEYMVTLNDPLKDLGMRLAFDNAADFSAMADPIPGEPLKIGKVLQKTYLDADEEGATAAAATAVIMLGGMAMPPHPEPRFDMVLDHPFLAAIVDNRTGTILFLSAINDPG